MSRVDDVIQNYLNTTGLCVLSDRTKKHIADAVRYGFNQGVSFGKYEAYCHEQNDKIAEAILQPINDEYWQKELESITKDLDKCTTYISFETKQTKLMALIAEMILYTRRGG